MRLLTRSAASLLRGWPLRCCLRRSLEERVKQERPPSFPLNTPAARRREARRLQSLRRYAILDTPPEPAFDRITALAARVFHAPFALISLVDTDRQWFKSCFGTDIRQTKRSVGFCPQAIQSPGGLVVPDTLCDPRFADNMLVTGPPHVRFYAGAPLIASDGAALGTLCVLDVEPRAFSAEQQATLADLAAMVMREIELRLAAAAAQQSREEYRLLFEASPQPLWVFDVQTLRFLAVNETAIAHYGYTRDEFLSMTIADIRPAEDVERIRDTVRRHGQNTENVGTWRHRRKDGSLAWVEVRSHSIDFEGRAARMVVVNNITKRHQTQEALRESEQRFQAFMDNSPAVAFMKDEQGRYVYMNKPFERAFQMTRADWLGKTVFDLFPPDVAETLHQGNQRVLESGRACALMETVPTPDGQERWWQAYKFPFQSNAGQRYLGSVAVDVTEQKQAEAALRHAEEKYRAIFEHTAEGIFQTDAEGRYLSANPALARLYGYDSPDALMAQARNVAQQLYVEPGRRMEFVRLMEAQDIVTDFESEVHCQNGTRVWISESARAVRDEAGTLLCYEGTVQDITERKALEAERESQLAEALARADRDPLTGLLNHRAFHKRLEQEADRARREGTMLAVAVMDMDNFKFFNDAYGHAVGDDVLRQVATALSGCCRSYDTLARFGGDEFALLLPGAGPAKAEDTARRLREAVQQLGYRPPGYDSPIPLALSVGLAVFPDDGPGRLDALTTADARLLLAKSGGGGEQAERLRASLNHSLEGFSMLDALVTAVDNKDRYTRKHSEDVMQYCVAIACALGLDEATRQTVRVAALLHDVGKIGVPDAILRKPGKLSETEFQAIQRHPMMGAVIMGAVPGFEETLDAVRHHHERWDGEGYPFGLRGEETPLLARIMAVADAYSAMTTDRPYRKGMGQARALSILEAGAGTQWDAECVQALLSTRREDAPSLCEAEQERLQARQEAQAARRTAAQTRLAALQARRLAGEAREATIQGQQAHVQAHLELLRARQEALAARQASQESESAGRNGRLARSRSASANSSTDVSI